MHKPGAHQRQDSVQGISGIQWDHGRTVIAVRLVPLVMLFPYSSILDHLEGSYQFVETVDLHC